MKCNVCFHHCEIKEGGTGLCLSRTCRDGKIVAENYGQVTSLALDPIEKKPLALFYPRSLILSVGSYGCNLRCPFCQNHQISYENRAALAKERARHTSPEDIAETAEECAEDGNIGVAFTYNEPLVGYEFVRDTARLVQKKGMKTVLVTNGTATDAVLDEILPYIDAMNVDLKAFSESFYRDFVGGDLETVKHFIERAAEKCHVEVTTLIIPNENDSEEEIDALARWLASVGQNCGRDIPLHITRFFPRFHLTDRDATPVETVHRLVSVAERWLSYVFAGNV